MKKKLFILLAIVTFLIGTVCSVNALTFYDSFEGQSFDPFWTTISQQYGTASLSPDQVHSGAQSAKFSSTDGVQREIGLGHNFPDVIKGEVSVWFYDTDPGRRTLYSYLTLFNSNVSWGDNGYRFGLGINDFDGYTYATIGPGDYIDSVSRTLGWHEFKININSTGSQMFIDDVLVNSAIGDFGFDYVSLTLSGPGWRPNATYYFDDLSITESAPVPEPCTMLLLGTGLLGLVGTKLRKTKK